MRPFTVNFDVGVYVSFASILWYVELYMGVT